MKVIAFVTRVLLASSLMMTLVNPSQGVTGYSLHGRTLTPFNQQALMLRESSFYRRQNPAPLGAWKLFKFDVRSAARSPWMAIGMILLAGVRPALGLSGGDMFPWGDPSSFAHTDVNRDVMARLDLRFDTLPLNTLTDDEKLDFWYRVLWMESPDIQDYLYNKNVKTIFERPGPYLRYMHDIMMDSKVAPRRRFEAAKMLMIIGAHGYPSALEDLFRVSSRLPEDLRMAIALQGHLWKFDLEAQSLLAGNQSDATLERLMTEAPGVRELKHFEDDQSSRREMEQWLHLPVRVSVPIGPEMIDNLLNRKTDPNVLTAMLWTGFSTALICFSFTPGSRKNASWNIWRIVFEIVRQPVLVFGTVVAAFAVMDFAASYDRGLFLGVIVVFGTVAMALLLRLKPFTVLGLRLRAIAAPILAFLLLAWLWFAFDLLHPIGLDAAILMPWMALVKRPAAKNMKFFQAAA